MENSTDFIFFLINPTLSFFCPEKFDLEIAKNLIFDLNILAKEQNRMRPTVSEQAFTVEKTNNLRDCDIIG